ncbi:RHS repeat-associated core domain-containing protein [Kitasatospora sp. NPDC089797]|uniref:RHS repeat-associated core domain-containing protein n=1 Tax=Kitasatospora sp. NPDC089797 TaxID=3155298 RepID=UPI0034223F9B
MVPGRSGPSRTPDRWTDRYREPPGRRGDRARRRQLRRRPPAGAVAVLGYGSANSWAGDKGYVGGLKDDATGFTNLGARQYQLSIGGFLSADPLLLPDDPQQWNAYAYSNNDPVNKTDPTGMALEECATGFAKCSTMGTKVDTTQDGPNYRKIVDQVNQEAPAREAGFVRFMIARGLPLGRNWVGSVPSAADIERDKRAARRAYGFELEKEYKKNTNFKYEVQPGQTQIPGAREGHEYADHISDMVNNEYGRKMGEKIAARNQGASDEQLKGIILDEARKYIASDDFARPSDFE